MRCFVSQTGVASATLLAVASLAADQLNTGQGGGDE